jgi:uncharacterized membrane protein YphA (DoxX/SURF4 family)
MVKGLFNLIPGWLILLAILVSGVLIYWIEDWNLIFTSLLVIEIALVIIFINAFGKAQITISRMLLGLLFIFSGFVKGVDPVGTQYRIEDYFIAFGTDWAIPLALPLSVILNATEFVLGFLLLFNVNMRITAWLVLIMMGVFTVLTLNDATNNPVPDCGCFGDALIISNWQTFYKNLVIDALLLIVFLTRKRIPGWFSYRIEWVLLVFSVLGFIFFQIHNLRHLPVIDFMDWKVGKNMVNQNPVPLDYYLTYRNKQTGETKEYLSPNYPFNDSSWVANWEFINQRIVDPNPHLHDLQMEDAAGMDRTAEIIENPGFQFILVMFDLSKANLKQIDKIRDLSHGCNQSGIAFAAITSSPPSDAEVFNNYHYLDTYFYFADDVVLMSMIRSNPGLILLKNGVVLEKWHHNDIPSFDQVKEVFPSFGN